jgi:hypothetical protein
MYAAPVLLRGDSGEVALLTSLDHALDPRRTASPLICLCVEPARMLELGLAAKHLA